MVLTLLALIAIPLGIMGYISLLPRNVYGGVDWQADWQLQSYVQLFSEEGFDGELELNWVYAQALLRSVFQAGGTTLLCFLFGFPVALWMSSLTPRRRNLMVLLITIPFWTNLLIRNYAWLIILREHGWVAQSLNALFPQAGGITLLYNDFAVSVGLVYSFLPFMILPICSTLEKLDWRLVEAAYDLGANRWHALRRIILPLSMPGSDCRRAAGVCAEPRRLHHPGDSRRRQDADDRQPDPATVRHRAQLAAGQFAVVPAAGDSAAVAGACTPSIAAAPPKLFVGEPPHDRPAPEKTADDPRSQPADPGLSVPADLCADRLQLQRQPLGDGVDRVLASPGTDGFWPTRRSRPLALNSIIVAGIATVCATAIALLAALATYRPFYGQKMVEGGINLPLILPEIITAVATLLLFMALGIKLGLLTVIVAHVGFCIPFAYLPIRARLNDLDKSLLEAANDLYANPWQVFRRVTLPLLWPAVLSGSVLAFVVSLDDFIMTFFVAGPGSTTLPVYIFSAIKAGVTPEINAISTLMLVISIVLVVLAFWLGQRGKNQ